MKLAECAREQEVVAAVVSSRWPDGSAEPGESDADLRDHVAGCATCREVAEVATAFRAEREITGREVRLPTAAHVWWRAELRVRQEAARAAARPIAVAEYVAAAAGAGLAAAIISLGGLGWSSGWMPPAAGAGVSRLANATLAGLSVLGSGPGLALAVAAAVAGLVLMPVALYLALSDK